MTTVRLRAAIMRSLFPTCFFNASLNVRQARSACGSFADAGRTLAGEVAGDFMFWPTGKHHFGWFLEPAYDYSFARGHQKSLGISFGLLIGIR